MPMRASQANRLSSRGSVLYVDRGGHQRAQGGQRIRILWLLVRTPTQDARKPNGDTGLVARTGLNAFERQLEDLFGLHAPHGPELLQRVAANPCVQLPDLGIGESRIGFGEWN